MNGSRKYIIRAAFVIIGLVFLIKLFGIQIIDNDYKLAAEKNTVRAVVEYPHRGNIYDRNGKVIVFNKPVFDLTVIMRDVEIDDTAAFCGMLNISKEEFDQRMEEIKNKRYFSSFKPFVFMSRLSEEEFGRIQDQLADFQGFYIQDRSERSYPHQSLGNVLGYTGEVTGEMLARPNYDYYSPGDFIGRSGIEAAYEKDLRGKRGVRHVSVNVRGIEQGSYRDGLFDSAAVAGADLTASIDLDLQQYGELLMKNKKGSIVAIEPSTGEILAIVSSPSYDPNLLSGSNFSKNYDSLNKNQYKLLFNRPVMGDRHPPGSIFKIAQALIGLQEEAVTKETAFGCNKSLVGCHNHPSPLQLEESIVNSCNPYYYSLVKKIIEPEGKLTSYKEIGQNLDKWKESMNGFGFGVKLGSDLSGEKSGSLPSSSYYDKIYGKKGWRFSTIYSLSIGQGEVAVAPLQMANFAAVIANRGYYYAPHFIKKINKSDRELIDFKKKHYAPVDEKYFSSIVNAMENVVLRGTGRSAQVPDISVCGKTGTAQNPHGKDHSVFIAFAPRENPKIALAVYVENAGFGGTWAAPIAGLLIEKYIKGKSEREYLEQRIINSTLIDQ